MKTLKALSWFVLATFSAMLLAGPVAATFNITIVKAFFGTAFVNYTIGFASTFAAPITGMAFTVPAAGTFTCTNIQEIVGKSDVIWVNEGSNRDYNPRVDAVKAILDNQTAKLEQITNEQEKDKTIKITWVNACDIELEDCDDKCEMQDGTELSSNCKTYAPTLCKTAKFMVGEEELRTNTLSPDEVVAKGLLKSLKEMDEYWAKQIALFLDLHKGHNNYAGIGDIVGSGVGVEETYINPALWNAALMGEFVLSAEVNRFNSPFLVSGSNLRKEYWNAQMNAANADGKGNLNMFDEMPMYFDVTNLDGQLSPDKMTFLLNKGAVAVGARWRESTTPKQYIGQNSQIRYSVASKVLPGFSYDVHYDTICKNGGMFHRFNLFLEGGIYLNPAGCNENETGIIGYKNAVAPEA